MKTIKLLFLAVILSFTTTTFAQQFSVGLDVGYTKPVGELYQGYYLYPNGTDNGINFEIDALYYPNILENRIGVGLVYNYTSMFPNTSDIEYATNNYTITMLALKIQANLFPAKSDFNAYLAVNLGSQNISNPAINNTEDDYEAIRAFAYSKFGVCSSVGIEYHNFNVNLKYYLPVEYTGALFCDAIYHAHGIASALSVNFGYRFYFGE